MARKWNNDEISSYLKSKGTTKSNYVAPEVELGGSFRTQPTSSIKSTVDALNSVEPTVKMTNKEISNYLKSKATTASNYVAPTVEINHLNNNQANQINNLLNTQTTPKYRDVSNTKADDKPTYYTKNGKLYKETFQSAYTDNSGEHYVYDTKEIKDKNEKNRILNDKTLNIKDRSKKDTRNFGEKVYDATEKYVEKPIENVVKNIANPKKWINKGAFEDGYQFGDVTRSIGATAADIGKNVEQGYLQSKEGILDFATNMLARHYSKKGDYETANYYKSLAQSDMIKGAGADQQNPLTRNVSDVVNILDAIKKGDMERLAKNVGLALVGNMDTTGITRTGIETISPLLKKENRDLLKQGYAPDLGRQNKEVLNQFIEQNSNLGQNAQGLAQGLGQLGDMYVTGSIGGAVGEGLGLGEKGVTALNTVNQSLKTSINVAGSSMNEAYQNGATDDEALTYGLISGAGEALTELISGGLGKGLNMVGANKGGLPFDDMVTKALTKNLNTTTGKNIVSLLVKSGGEGMEEVLSNLISTWAKSITYMDDKSFSELVNSQELMDEFIMGSLVSLVAQAPATVQASAMGIDMTNENLNPTDRNGNELDNLPDIQLQEQLQQREQENEQIRDEVEEQDIKDTIDALNLEENLEEEVEETEDNIQETEQQDTNDDIESLLLNLSSNEVRNNLEEYAQANNIENLSKEDIQNFIEEAIEKENLNDENKELLRNKYNDLLEDYLKDQNKPKVPEQVKPLAEVSLAQNDTPKSTYKGNKLELKEDSKKGIRKPSEIAKDQYRVGNQLELQYKGFEDKSKTKLPKSAEAFLYENGKANQDERNRRVEYVEPIIQRKGEVTTTLGNTPDNTRTRIRESAKAISLEAKKPFKQIKGNYQYVEHSNPLVDEFRRSAATYLKANPEAEAFVKVAEKIIKDKNLQIKFDPNLKSKDGRTANGSYGNGVITLNPTSNRAMEFLLMHEVTHSIATKEMIDMVKTYREGGIFGLNKNTEFDNAVNNLLKSYSKGEVNEEALADISGQLFGNQEFINNLAQDKPSAFKKIYNEIKYLWHQLRGYKNQNEFIQDLYNKWTDAYNNNFVKRNTTKSSKVTMSNQVDSNGNQLSQQQVDKFKNSKVRDENGNLKVVYHGTPTGNFNVFDKSKMNTRDSGFLGEGFYFTPDIEDAELYSYEDFIDKPGKNSEVKETYLNIENPYIIPSNVEYNSDMLSKRLGVPRNEIQSYLKQQGYDGIIYNNPAHQEIVAFEPNQIKNTDNLNPTSSDDIRYSKNLADQAESRNREDNKRTEELEDSSYLIENNDDIEKLNMPKSPYQTLRPNVRGGWNIDKIQKQLKNESSNRVNSKDLSKFDNLDDLMNNLYYHGSISAHDNLKAGSTLQENQRTGGYGAEYHSISLSKNKNIASNFASMGQNGTVMPVILKKNANVIEMPNIEDSIELEDILPELWNKGVDAVKIGDWDIETKGYGEQEIVILNPRAIMTMPQGTTYFQNYHKPKFQNMTKEEVLETLTKTKERALSDSKLKPGQAEEIESRYDKLIKYSKDTEGWNDYVSNTFTKDSSGNKLSKKQQEYFKDSKAVNDKGELQVVYHGANRPGFTVFNPSQKKNSDRFGNYKFKDQDVNYFTASKDVATGYTEFGTIDVGNEVYEGYLNITNPYTVENSSQAEIKSWKNIKDNNIRQYETDYYDKFEEKWNNDNKYIEDVFDELNEDLFPFNHEIRYNDGYYELWDLGNNSLYGTENYKIYVDNNATTKDLFDEGMKDWIYGESFDDYFYTSDDITKWVITQNTIDGKNYDGIIIPNIVDNGPRGSMFGEPTTDYVTFNSNQFKNINNENPTDNEDIRYSKEEVSLSRAKQSFRKNITKYGDGGAFEDAILKYNLRPEELDSLYEYAKKQSGVNQDVIERLYKQYKEIAKNSKENESWREYLEREFPATGTRTSFDTATGRKTTKPTKTTTEEKTAEKQPKNEPKKVNYLTQEEQDELDGLKSIDNSGWTELTPEEQARYDELTNKSKGIVKKYPELKTNNSFNDIKSIYGKYKESNMKASERKVLNEAKSIVEANRQGRRTMEQWLKIAEHLGSNANINSVEDLQKLAIESWFETKPNNANNLNRQGKKYVPFAVNDWVNSVYKGAGVGTDIKLSVEEGIDNQGKKVELRPTQENVYEKVNVPTKNQIMPETKNESVKIGNKKVSNFYSNITEKSKFITEENRESLKDNENLKYYDAITNKETLRDAMDRLDKNAEQSVGDFFTKENFTADDVATGWILMKRYQDAGNYEAMSNVIEKMREQGTKSGQAIQMLGMLDRLTPEGMEYYAQKQLDNAYNKFTENKSKKEIEKYANDFTLTAEEHQFIKDQMEKVQQLDDEDAKKVEVAKIVKMLSDKLPPEKGAGIKAWMRIAMLGNAKTQVRNIMGNAIIQPVNWTGDIFGNLVDKAISKKTGVRTKGNTDFGALAGGFIKGGKDAIRDAKLGIDTRDINLNRFEENIGAKPFYEHGKSKVLNAGARALNKINQITGDVMSGGDRIFYQSIFDNSLKNQMKLNNTNVPTQEMVDIATQEALSRTWNDSNSYTKAVLQIRSAMNKLNIKGYGLGDVLVPFAKTPANLTKAIVDYSPVGLVKSILQDGRNLKNSLENGQYNAQLQHKFADSFGKGVAGSILWTAAYALAKAGITSGASDDDKDVANFMRNTMGIQPYSVKIGNKSFTYDWAQPIAAPLAAMSDFQRLSEKEEKDLGSIIKTFTSSASNILLEQSFLSSIQDVFNSYNGPTEAIQQQIQDLPARATPTFFKQVADLIDPKQRQTFVKGDDLQTAKNKVQVKIPGASKSLASQRDTLGREIEKYGGDDNKLKYAFNVFLNPANTNKGKPSKAAEEIYDVYKNTGDKTVMPRQVGYSEYINGKSTPLTAEERNKWQKLAGEKVEDSVKALAQNEKYQAMSYEDKADVINGIVNYSFAKAKSDIYDTPISTTYRTAAKNEEKGMSIADYYINRVSKRK